MNIYKEIATLTEETLNLPKNTIYLKCRRRRYSMARQMCYLVIYNLKQLDVDVSLIGMSRELKQDHSTGLHGLNVAMLDYNSDDEYKEKYETIYSRVLKMLNIKAKEKLLIIKYADEQELTRKLQLEINKLRHGKNY